MALFKKMSVCPAVPVGAFFKEEEIPPLPAGALFKEVVVKREREVVVGEGGRSNGQAKGRGMESNCA